MTLKIKYNSLINIKRKIKHEKMYRRDNKYDLLIVLGYNVNKPIPYRGSAIFITLQKIINQLLAVLLLNKKTCLFY